jgi:hypothetical protein
MKNIKSLAEFINETSTNIINSEDKYEDLNENRGINVPPSVEGIFILEKKFPFGLPNDIADYYVNRKDGKIGTSSWNSFEELIMANPGIKFGSYANSNRISIYTALRNGQVLIMQEVYIQKIT